MASAQHRADFYEKGFSCKCFIQKLWCRLLTMIATRPITAILSLFFDSKPVQKPNWVLNAGLLQRSRACSFNSKAIQMPNWVLNARGIVVKRRYV